MMEEGKAFTDRIEDTTIKIKLLLAGEKTANKANSHSHM
jgi:hypothetical protein